MQGLLLLIGWEVFPVPAAQTGSSPSVQDCSRFLRGMLLYVALFVQCDDQRHAIALSRRLSQREGENELRRLPFRARVTRVGNSSIY